MVNKIRQFALPIDSFASITYWVGQRSGTATEDTHFANLKSIKKSLIFAIYLQIYVSYIAVFLLNEFKERWHVWAAKMVDGL